MDIKKEFNLKDPYEIAKFIKNAKKTTPVKAYVKGNLKNIDDTTVEIYGEGNFFVVFGESNSVVTFISTHKDNIKTFRLEFDRRNSAIPMLDVRNIDARIEPGAIIR